MGESEPVRDFDADGDRALLRIDGGMDINGDQVVDNTQPGSVATVSRSSPTPASPGFFKVANRQRAVRRPDDRHDAIGRGVSHRHRAGVPPSRCGDGRRRRAGGVYADFKRAVYVDRLPPESEIVAFEPFASEPEHGGEPRPGRTVGRSNRRQHARLLEPARRADRCPGVATRAQWANDAGEYDVDSWIYGFTNVTTGNHVATVVTFESTFDGVNGINVQRFPGLFTATGLGAGFGDLNANGVLQVVDIQGKTNGSFETVPVQSELPVQGNCRPGWGRPRGQPGPVCPGPGTGGQGGEQVAVLAAYESVLRGRGDLNLDAATNAADVAALYGAFGGSAWLMDLNVDGLVDVQDVQTLITDIAQTVNGDFDLDGDVDGSDFLVWQRGVGTMVAVATTKEMPT